MSADAGRRTPKRSRRLAAIVLVGLIAIVAGLSIRNSTWARERALKKLNVDELALAIHDSPKDPLTFIYFGSALMKENDIAASAGAFSHAAKLDPKSARAHLGLGSALFRMGKLKEASEAFKQAIKLDPNLPDAHLGLSQVYYRAGSPKRALEPMKKLTELQPKNAVAWFTLGQFYGDSHMSDLALEALRKATELDPGKHEYWRSLGRLCQHYTRLDEAEKHYLQALTIEKNDPIAYLWLGQLYLQMGDTPALRGKAESSLHRAISRDPMMGEAYFALGQLYERRAIWDMASLNFRKAHEINPADDQSLYHLGLTLVKQGKSAEGKKLITAAQELGTVSREIKNLENRCIAEPDNRELRLRLARVYRKYGNDEGAVARYKEYVSMGPVDAAIEKETAAYRAELERRPKPEPSREARAAGGPRP